MMTGCAWKRRRRRRRSFWIRSPPTGALKRHERQKGEGWALPVPLYHVRATVCVLYPLRLFPPTYIRSGVPSCPHLAFIQHSRHLYFSVDIRDILTSGLLLIFPSNKINVLGVLKIIGVNYRYPENNRFLLWPFVYLFKVSNQRRCVIDQPTTQIILRRYFNFYNYVIIIIWHCMSSLGFGSLIIN